MLVNTVSACNAPPAPFSGFEAAPASSEVPTLQVLEQRTHKNFFTPLNTRPQEGASTLQLKGLGAELLDNGKFEE